MDAYDDPIFEKPSKLVFLYEICIQKSLKVPSREFHRNRAAST